MSYTIAVAELVGPRTFLQLLRVLLRAGYHFKARGGSKGQKCLIFIFQYVIELEKMNQMQKTGGQSDFPFSRYRDSKIKVYMQL